MRLVFPTILLLAFFVPWIQGITIVSDHICRIEASEFDAFERAVNALAEDQRAW